ncbi:aromatic ring-hydroxylating dioxygenase subunit alpha [Sphingomonas koreensis]|nr:aromatic ring-hydroxylating dioxygenase subunit alpha [Sphingomonas koreensis]
MMRRYWQPVRASDKVSERPEQIRVLGEDLILFRDGAGQPGLLYPHCIHRGASLLYGHVEDDGIRCCYHGWKFNVQGRCLEQPCEPKGGTNLASARQPWYPVQERYGLVWAYMGPPDKMPLLPRFENLENLGEDERYYVLDNSFSSHADLNGPEVVPYSWLNINDNCMDPYHVFILHSNFGTTHFNKNFAVMPKVTWEEIDRGVIYKAYRSLPDGREMMRILTWVAPNISVNPGAGEGGGGSLSIFVPVDDGHVRVFNCMKVGPDFTRPFADQGIGQMKPWSEMTFEEHQDAPNDYEAQVSQGPNGLPSHSQEHLVTSDKGIGLQRRVLRREIKKVQNGDDPINLVFNPQEELITTPSGNFYQSGAAMEKV